MHAQLRIFWLLVFVAVLTASFVIGNGQKTSQPQSQPARVVDTPSASPGKSQDPADKQAESETEVVRVETNLVNTLFTAVDKDRHFITSLRLEDVRIFENDVAQPVSLFERETDRPLSLAILVDTSASQAGVLAEEKRTAR